MKNSIRLLKSAITYLILTVSSVMCASAFAEYGKQVFIPIGVGDITTFIPLLSAPASVSVTEQTQPVGESVHELSWQAVNNAAYYQINITDEVGETKSITVENLRYTLSDLPLGESTAVLLACNVQNQCGASVNLGTFNTAKRIRYAVADILGSPILEADQAGNVISEFHYKPFGETEEEKVEDIGYTGHLEDTDLELTYMQARYYDPVIGRFLSNDPVGFLEHLNGTQGVQGFNRYAYVNNNPYKYTDPNGEVAVFGFIAGVGLEVARQAITGELDGGLKSVGKIAVAGLAGATGAGLGRGIASLTTSVAARAGANAVAGAGVGAASTAGNNAIDGKNLTDGLATGAALGAAGGALGSVVGDGVDAASSAAKSGAFNKLSTSDKNLIQHISETTNSAQGATNSTAVGVGEAIGNTVSNSAGTAQAATCNSGQNQC